MEEIWNDVIGYKGLYRISNIGRVWSVQKNRIKKTFNNNIEYEYVSFCVKGVEKKYGVHTLVAKCFVGGYIEGLEVNHKDGNKMNNVCTNLEWITHKENMAHMRKMHLKDRPPKEIKPKPANREPRVPREEIINLLIKMPSMVDVGRIFGVSANCIVKWCKKYGIPCKKSDIVTLKKENGTYIPSKKSMVKRKEERFKHYDVEGEKLTAQGWSLRLGLEGKRIGRYANSHSYEETVEYIKYWMSNGGC